MRFVVEGSSKHDAPSHEFRIDFAAVSEQMIPTVWSGGRESPILKLLLLRPKTGRTLPPVG